MTDPDDWTPLGKVLTGGELTSLNELTPKLVIEHAQIFAKERAEQVAELVKAARGLLKYASPYSAGWTCNGAHIDQLTAALKPFDREPDR